MPQAPPAPKQRKYGGRFSNGFASWLQSQDLADTTVVCNGKEYRAHMLLLANASEFFRAAFTAKFREAEERRITLGFDDPAGVWPSMLAYFYTDEITLTDDTVLPLLAMSRELMVKHIEDYCADYAQNSLEASNAIQYLNQAVQFNCDAFRESCVALVAEGFPQSFAKPTDGLPPEVVLEVLQHPGLVVQTEEQALVFVLTYVKRHALHAALVRALFEHVRLPFLPNERLAGLAQEEAVPKDMLLAAMAARFTLLDHPERLAPPSAATASAAPAPSHPTGLSVQQASAASLPATAAASSSGATGLLAAAAPSAHSSPPPSSLRLAGGSDMSASGGSNVQGSAGPATPHSSVLAGALACASAPSGQQGLGSTSSCAGGVLPPHMLVPRKTYCCTMEYGLPGGCEYAALPLHEVWEELVPQLRVRVSGDVVEGDAESILRVHDQEAAWFMVSSDNGAAPVWIEVELPPNMRVAELSKFTFSHGMNFATHMFPYGISDSAWCQMKGLVAQVCSGDSDQYVTLRTAESSTMQFEYAVAVEGPAQAGAGAQGVGGGLGAARVPPWRRLRISTCEEQASGSVRLSVRKLRLYGRLEVSLTREGPPGARDVLLAWRRRKEAAAARGVGSYTIRKAQSVAVQ